YRRGDDRAGMFFEVDYYANSKRGAVQAWRNEMAEMSWTYWLTFNGLRAAAGGNVLTVMVHGDGCVLPGNARSVYAALRGPKQLEWIDGNKIDFSGQPRQGSAALAAIEPHFRATLGSD